ncbi:LysM peptidoglycan-binding domain-containing protein [Paenibacillus sp. TRM 82003]|nr:LysM peptidoglycan-binding domain-containing protein [Kineococcus sp. TRM81007]MCI3926762.1 LysM peptidoglycan-binding domain-containing protein [Paenibacillus sp. TRM 82003]
MAGDTLTSIAAAHGTTVAALRDANGLDARGFIRAGQVLKLSGSTTADAQQGTQQGAGQASGTYTVRAGDTLSHIAAATGTTVATLVELNGLDRTGFIVEGQELLLAGDPQATPVAPPASEQASSLSQAVEANRARLARADIPSRDEMRELIRSTAVRLGVDPSLALAIGYQESGFNMGVVSHANAIGAMQVIPTSGEWASDLLGEPIDLFDARDNAKAGVVILRTLVASNPPEIAIASYYQGQASVRSRGMYDDTRRYVANVQTLQARFR